MNCCFGGSSRSYIFIWWMIRHESIRLQAKSNLNGQNCYIILLRWICNFSFRRCFVTNVSGSWHLKCIVTSGLFFGGLFYWYMIDLYRHFA